MNQTELKNNSKHMADSFSTWHWKTDGKRAICLLSSRERISFPYAKESN